MPLELVPIASLKLNRETLRSFVHKRGAAFLEGWSEDAPWKIVLPWPEEVLELAWSRTAHWLQTLASLSSSTLSSSTNDCGSISGSPFRSGWVGFVSYELGAELEDARPRECDPIEPPFFFARHERAILVDPRGRHFLCVSSELLEESLRELAAMAAEAERRAIETATTPVSARHTIRTSLDATDYESRVSEIRESIANGDVYQVNLTRSFTIDAALDPFHLYFALTGATTGALTGAMPPRCSALIHGGDWTVASASPEVFLTYDALNGRASSRPIKGTIERTGDDAGDRARLLTSAKDAAEHLMIVDLVRNDFGKIAPAGNVSVPLFREVLELERLLHLESTVEVSGISEVPFEKLFSALFPAGSITGAPKRAAVRQIRELEPAPRGIYSGTIGFFDRGGVSQWSVAIRTAVVSARETRYHAGGGIVWESVPSLEENESRAKAAQFLSYAAGDSPDRDGTK